jgi:hypothetical protein
MTSEGISPSLAFEERVFLRTLRVIVSAATRAAATRMAATRMTALIVRGGVAVTAKGRCLSRGFIVNMPDFSSKK